MLHPDKGSVKEGLKAEYFSQPSFDGIPVKSVIDPQINFNWSGVNPLANEAEHGFAVRWSGVLSVPQPGSYEFTLRGGPCRGCAREQSYRVLIDGKEIASTPPAPVVTGPVPTRINGTTGLPEEVHQQGPLHFTVSFEAEQSHQIEVQLIRRRADQGSGLTLEWTPPKDILLAPAIAAARKSDLIIAILGLSPNLEGEEMPVKLEGFSGGDRTDIDLPKSQAALLANLVATHKPLVVVLLNGSALAVNFADKNANAILEAWYPGEAGGKAIVDTLLGRNNPAGRLPITFYKSSADLPSFDDYSMKNRTYRYFTGAPLYSFGYGLSYTRFAYSDLRLSTSKLAAGNHLSATVKVTNSGKLAGDEVTEAYIIPPSDDNDGLSPKTQLCGYQRVHLAPGESKTVTFDFEPRWISEVDAKGDRSVRAGVYKLAVGGAQPNDPRAPSLGLNATFEILGSQPLPH
jgi:beta-glucosidase